MNMSNSSINLVTYAESFQAHHRKVDSYKMNVRAYPGQPRKKTDVKVRAFGGFSGMAVDCLATIHKPSLFSSLVCPYSPSASRLKGW